MARQSPYFPVYQLHLPYFSNNCKNHHVIVILTVSFIHCHTVTCNEGNVAMLLQVAQWLLALVYTTLCSMFCRRWPRGVLAKQPVWPHCCLLPAALACVIPCLTLASWSTSLLAKQRWALLSYFYQNLNHIPKQTCWYYKFYFYSVITLQLVYVVLLVICC